MKTSELDIIAKDLRSAYNKANDSYELYQAEVARGLVHTEKWKLEMATVALELSLMKDKAYEASEAWRKTLPPYDPDNHISCCGCVVQNGVRTLWCGDHY